MKWGYKISKITKEATPFGVEPFGHGDLSDKVRVDPYGHVGGDSRTGVFEESWGKHHSNDYFSESDNTPNTEKRLQKQKEKRKKKKRVRKRKNVHWSYDISFKKESQWGIGGPKLPVWQDDWVMRTYKDITNPRGTPQQPQKPPSKKKRKGKPKSKKRKMGLDFSPTSLESEGNNPYKKALKGSVSIRSFAGDSFEIGSGFFINSNMVVTCHHVSFPHLSGFSFHRNSRGKTDPSDPVPSGRSCPPDLLCFTPVSLRADQHEPGLSFLKSGNHSHDWFLCTNSLQKLESGRDHGIVPGHTVCIFVHCTSAAGFCTAVGKHWPFPCPGDNHVPVPEHKLVRIVP